MNLWLIKLGLLILVLMATGLILVKLGESQSLKADIDSFHEATLQITYGDTQNVDFTFSDPQKFYNAYEEANFACKNRTAITLQNQKFDKINHLKSIINMHSENRPSEISKQWAMDVKSCSCQARSEVSLWQKIQKGAEVIAEKVGQLQDQA